MGNYKKVCGIYTILCAINKKVYVGQSTHLRKRWAFHRYELTRGIHSNQGLQDDWDRYGRDAFAFSIVENLDFDLSVEDYVQAETKWVLHFKSHKTKFGYNKTLPGNIPLREEDENKTILSCGVTHSIHPTYVISIKTGEVVRFENSAQASAYTDISIKKINDCFLYWGDNPKNADKSYKGWIFIREKDYKEGFDYINYRRPAIITTPRKIKPKEELKGHHKKLPEDIIPYEERNIKRVPIIAVNIETKEETLIPTMSHATKYGFNLTKVLKCINHEYGRYKHKDHYFKKVS